LTTEDRAAAREAAILKLWERGKISTRAAARSLGLTYHEFLDRLAEEGIAAVQADELSHEALHEFLRLSEAEGSSA
jgi:predicted HTH domain antitoxin